MNYLAHAISLLDRPYVAAGTAVPDWLSVVDRRVRLRRRHLKDAVDDADPVVADIARGVRLHLEEDAVFHGTEAFSQTLADMTRLIRRTLDGATNGDGRLPAQFLAHLLTEVLLDAALVDRFPEKVEAYYRLLDSLDVIRLEAVVTDLAPRPPRGLGVFVSHFSRARILWDYLEDAKLLSRMNQVMGRIGLPKLATEFQGVFPEARSLVADRARTLLEGTRAAEILDNGR
ncbi:MAG: hypothetical protein D6741_03470 [Planctomycetota bacterium]|nr:MAG: hypothetical protein D6741_03470 [Planctomycetota bacterium]